MRFVTKLWILYSVYNIKSIQATGSLCSKTVITNIIQVGSTEFWGLRYSPNNDLNKDYSVLCELQFVTLVWNILLALNKIMCNCRCNKLSDQILSEKSFLHKDLKVIISFEINLVQIQALPLDVQMYENFQVHNFEYGWRYVLKILYTLIIFLKISILLLFRAQFMKKLVLRSLHLSQVTNRLLITSSCWGPPVSQDLLKGKVNSWPSKYVNGDEGDVPCMRIVWQHHSAVIFLRTCLSECLWMLLGKKGHLCCRVSLVEGKGTGGRICKQHSHPSLLPHLTLPAGKKKKKFLLRLMPLQATAV